MLFGKKQRRISRLLVVEDEPLVAFDVEHFLTEQGYLVLATVDRVADAVGLIAAGHGIDLVMVDVALTDGSGIDVARAAQQSGVPVLFVTGHCSADMAALAIGCLSKPFAHRDLLAAIHTIEATLDGRRPRRLPRGFRLFGDAD